MSSLGKLQQLALVNKVTKELENHLGIADKTLSEFVIALADENSTPGAFRDALGSVGAEVDDAFAESLLSLIQRGLKRGGSTTGGTKVGGTSTRDGSENASGASTKDAVWSGLAVRDNDERARAMTRELYGDRDVKANAADDPRLCERVNDRETSHSREVENSTGEERMRDGEPSVGEVCRGRVTNVLDFGAFVELVEFKRKFDGLVHVSAIAYRHLKSAKDGASRGYRVFVKVLSRNGQKMSLSMKEVDQITGKETTTSRGAFGGNRSNPAPRSNLPPPGPSGDISLKGLSGINPRALEDGSMSSRKRPVKRLS